MNIPLKKPTFIWASNDKELLFALPLIASIYLQQFVFSLLTNLLVGTANLFCSCFNKCYYRDCGCACRTNLSLSLFMSLSLSVCLSVSLFSFFIFISSSISRRYKAHQQQKQHQLEHSSATRNPHQSVQK